MKWILCYMALVFQISDRPSENFRFPFNYGFNPSITATGNPEIGANTIVMLLMRKTTLKDVYILITRTNVYVILHGKSDLNRQD